MPLVVKKTSVVVTGHWNPAIVEPRWLIQRKVIDEVPSEISLQFDVANKRLSFTLGGVNWKVTDTRLEVTSSAMTDCGVFVARVLSLLSHTPVRGVGINFVWTCPKNEWPPGKQPSLGDLSPEKANADGFYSVDWIGRKKLPDSKRLTLIVQSTPEQVTLNCNVHQNVSSAMAAQELAGQWSHYREVVAETVRTMFNLSE